MEQKNPFTEGKIFAPLIRFALPVFFALCLQAMYGAVDLLVVGQFGQASDVSAVATGSQVMHVITAVIAGLSLGTTVLLGQAIGRKEREQAGSIVGGGICFFAAVSAIVTVLMLLIASPFARLMQAPQEAFSETVRYIRICSAGSVFIVAYNVLGSVFRGIGDSKTPLLTVFFACIFNIAGDLLFVAVLHMAASGAALATVLAQALSVVLCLLIVKKRGLPFPITKKQIRFDKAVIGKTFRLGFPIALQDGLVSISFLVLLGIVNTLGVIASAGVGVAEKLCMFIMLVPSAFAQSLSAFVAQDIGAGKPERAKKTLLCGIALSFAAGVLMAYVSFFHGEMLSGMFSADSAVIAASAEYLKAYAIDTMLVAFLFCFIGYFNGCGSTTFVMIQGIVGAFLVRIPVSYLMSRITPPSLFLIGLATPCSTVVQILLCCVWFFYSNRDQTRLKK